MKIIHLPSTFFPDHTGGKELFVYQLVKNLPQHEHLVVVHAGNEARKYNYKGVNVQVLPEPLTSNYRYSYFSLQFGGLDTFVEVIDEFKPDLVHFHDQSSGASLSHLEIVKSKNVRSLLTYHSPGQSSLQRALIRNGTEPCDGHLDITRCTVCRYRSQGLPKVAASIAGHLSIPGIDPTGKIFFRKSTRLYLDMWRDFYGSIDAIQVHAQWVKEMLLINSIDERKIHYVELGGSESMALVQKTSPDKDLLKLVFVGRCTDIKGVHLLIDAVKSLPDLNLEVHFFGPGWTDNYGRSLQSRIGSDTRFKQPVLLDPDSVLTHLEKMDVAVIPSLWPETGPFTVFDAFAARLPVIGTRHAGIAERCRDNIDSLLFDWGNSAALASKISALYHDRKLLSAMRSNIGTNRTFREFSADIGALYEKGQTRVQGTNV